MAGEKLEVGAVAVFEATVAESEGEREEAVCPF